MCRWMGSHFHNWTDYTEVTFLVESQNVRDFWDKKILVHIYMQGFKNMVEKWFLLLF